MNDKGSMFSKHQQMCLEPLKTVRFDILKIKIQKLDFSSLNFNYFLVFWDGQNTHLNLF